MLLRFLMIVVLTAAAGCHSATAPPPPATAVGHGLHIDVVPGKSNYASAKSPIDCTIRFTNDTDSAVLLPAGEILFEKHLILRLFRRTDPNPFAADDNLDESSVDYWAGDSEKTTAITIRPGGHYDYRVNFWPGPDWVFYINFGNRIEDQNTGGDWLVQARFDGKYFADPPQKIGGPPVWRTACLSPVVAVHFDHGIAATQP